jgi:acyl-CoA synthetase (AMP-forming)/AMP-acid ligase II
MRMLFSQNDMSDSATTIPILIDRAARWFGDADAVHDGERTLSFRQVGERSNRVANALLGLGPDTGARVALLTPNRLESVEMDFGIAKAGKVRVPINTRLADGEREYLLANSGAETLIFDVQFAPFVEAVRRRLPELRNLIALGGQADGSHPYDELLGRASSAAPQVPHPADAPNFILYTSGTTGRPKGATATNGSRLAATVNMLAEEIEAVPGDAMVHIGSMAHGSGSKILAYFLRGARNLPVAKFEPDRFLHLVERERATATFVVPTMIAMLVEAAEQTRTDFSSLKTVTYGGAPIAPEKLRTALERFGNVFVQVYGSSEAPHPVLVMRKAEHQVAAGQERRLASLGREVAMAQLRIIGPDGNDAPEGERGEMLIKGPNVMSGYWKNPEATAEVLQGGWYRTGDVVSRDQEGFYYMVDRVRDMIISGGLNIYPAEVEAAIRQHPSVADVAVIGIPDERWGESVKAFVVLNQSMQANEEEIIRHAQQILAGYKKPRSVEFVAGLPKGSTGKVLKRQLRDDYWRGNERAVN